MTYSIFRFLNGTCAGEAMEKIQYCEHCGNQTVYPFRHPVRHSEEFVKQIHSESAVHLREACRHNFRHSGQFAIGKLMRNLLNTDEK